KRSSMPGPRIVLFRSWGGVTIVWAFWNHCNRIERVLNKIQKNPLKCGRVAGDFWEAWIKHLLDSDAVGRVRVSASHPQRLMKHLMNIDGFGFEPQRAGHGQDLLYQ